MTGIMDVIVDVIMDFRRLIYSGSTRTDFLIVFYAKWVWFHIKKENISRGMKCSHCSTVDSRIMLGRTDA